MLTELLFSLRERAPLDRSPAEMGRLLERAVERFPAEPPPMVSMPKGYTRTCAYADERFEVLLLNWSAGSSSTLHDHGGRHCWVAVLDGQVLFENYDRLDAGDVPGEAIVAPSDAAIARRGDLDLRALPNDIHRVSAAGGRSALTLHVYARPLREFNVYDEFSRRCRRGFSRYDAVLPFDAGVPAG